MFFVTLILLRSIYTQGGPIYTYDPNKGHPPMYTQADPQTGCYYTNTQNGLVQVCPRPANQQPTTLPTREVIASFPVMKSVVKTTSRVVSPKESPIDSLMQTNPELGDQIKRIFEYQGIAEPWDRIKDFFDNRQRLMPDPCMLYKTMRDILKVFESLKEMISDELRKIQVYVERAKMYLKEDHVKLKDQLSRMSLDLVKMKSTKDKKNQNDYANNFNKINAETQQVIASYNRLKEWLFKTLTYFKQLF